MKQTMQFRHNSFSMKKWSSHFSPGILSYSTKTRILNPTKSKDTLFARLSENQSPKNSMVPILDKWVSEGRAVEKDNLIKTIKLFRRYHRCNHALQVCEWLTESKHIDLSPEDVALRLDLISKVHGSEQAETYFNTLPDDLRVSQVYDALLNSYVDAKSLNKAEAILQKMKNMDCASTLSYNGMLNLYSHLQNHEKLHSLMQEMEDNGVAFNRLSYSIMLNAHASTFDTEGMEKLMSKMETDPLVNVGFQEYVIMSKGYLQSNEIEKALAVLQKSEQLVENQEKKFAYELLLTTYASMGRKDDVYRLWGLLKSQVKLNNSSYLCMVSSLAKVDDLDGASSVLEEWEGQARHFDILIPNYLIGAYCSRGDVEKAELIVERLVRGGKEGNGSTWGRMALGYCKRGEMDRAVEMLKKAFRSGQKGWKPYGPTFSKCMKYLKQKGDFDQEGEIMKMLDECRVSVATKKRLLLYLDNENAASEVLDDSEGAVC